MDSRFKLKFEEKWITKGVDKDGILYLEKLGLFLCDKQNEGEFRTGQRSVTTSQLRNIFSEIKRIELKADASNYDWSPDFFMLRAKIAYNTARVVQKKKDTHFIELRQILEDAHSKVGSNKENLKRFSSFFEAIIAYHKVYGGKENENK